jgi:hypothetical protein
MVKINPYICDMELKPINKSYGGYISIDNLYEFISINKSFLEKLGITEEEARLLLS